MTLRRSVAAAFVLLILAVVQSEITAHHSASQYALEEAAMRGVVAQVMWKNPHVTIAWDAKDKSGNAVHWTGELASVSTVMAEGLTKNSVKVGDDLIFVYRPSKTGVPDSIIAAILRPDGQIVLAFSRQAGGSAEERAKRSEARLKLLQPFGIKVTAE